MNTEIYDNEIDIPVFNAKWAHILLKKNHVLKNIIADKFRLHHEVFYFENTTECREALNQLILEQREYKKTVATK